MHFSLASVALPAVVCAWFFDLLYASRGHWTHGVVLLPAVLCYLMLFSALVVAQKWIIVYRYRSCALQRWSLAFLLWWWMDRQLEIWEYLVGRWISNTVLLNLFYKLLGADVALTAQLDSFVREPDLVTLGAGASVTGNLLPRLVYPDGVVMLPVHVESCARVETGAFVPAGVTLHEGALLEPMSVPSSGTELPPFTRWTGNPARPREGEPKVELGSCAILWAKLSGLLIFWLVAILCGRTALVLAQLMQRDGDGLLPVSLNVWILVVVLILGVGMMATVALVALKWVLFGRVVDGAYGGPWWEARTLLLSNLFKLAFRGFLQFVECLPGVNEGFVRVLGGHVARDSYFTSLLTVDPWLCDLVQVESESFVSVSRLVPAVHGRLMSIVLKARANIGVMSRVEGGAVLEADAAVANCSFCSDTLRPFQIEVGVAADNNSRVLVALEQMRRNANRGLNSFHSRAFTPVKIALRVMLNAIYFGMMFPAVLAGTAIFVACEDNVLGTWWVWSCAVFVGLLVWHCTLFVVVPLVSCILVPSQAPGVPGPWELVRWEAERGFVESCDDMLMMFQHGSWSAAFQHRLRGAQVALDALIFSRVVDSCLVTVAAGAVLDKQVYFQGHTVRPDGTFEFFSKGIGEGGTVSPGGCLVANYNLGPHATLDVGSCSQIEPDIAGHSVVSGSPAKAVRGRVHRRSCLAVALQEMK